MKFIVEASSLAELAAALAELTGGAARVHASVVAGDDEDDTNHAAPLAAQNRAGMTAQQIIAGMTRKPTASATLSDNTKVSTGDYVRCGGEVWAVDATYRGSLVVTNEAGKSDVVSTADCTAVPDSDVPPPTTAQPAPAFATNPAQQVACVGPAKAAELRATATDAVSRGALSAQQVYDWLRARGADNIDALNAHAADEMGVWLQGFVAPPQNAMGF